MKILVGIALLSCVSFVLKAQKFSSTKSEVSFYSEASIEDISATNKEGSSIFDLQSGEIAFIIPISAFEFEKSLMQEHFNEKYMESDKHPRATFEGIITGYSKDIATPQSVIAKGKLTIHGVTRSASVEGTLLLQGERTKVNAKFVVRLEDHKVKIPKLLWSNIAEEVEVEVDFDYSKM
ncbi:MAG: YceI family protein [Cyclobacteriaceae bacterium]